MKAIIFSDSHRQFSCMMQAIKKESPIDMIIHAGDVKQDTDDLEIMYPNIPIVCVKGNNDYFDLQTPEERVFEIDGIRILLTHGHNYGVKYSTAKLWKHAKDLNAKVCIFGHTHKRLHEVTDGVEMFNPGSAYSGYGVLKTDANGCCLKICDLE